MTIDDGARVQRRWLDGCRGGYRRLAEVDAGVLALADGGDKVGEANLTRFPLLQETGDLGLHPANKNQCPTLNGRPAQSTICA